jgi:Domain of unknown function (DUF929)
LKFALHSMESVCYRKGSSFKSIRRMSFLLYRPRARSNKLPVADARFGQAISWGFRTLINKHQNILFVVSPRTDSSSTFIPRKVLGKFMHVSDQPLKRRSGKVLIFFRGAGFCPYCASERWAIVRALSIYGRWQGLVDTTGADHDEKCLNIPTVDFSKAKYISDHVELFGRETAYRNFEPVQELDKAGYEILDASNPDQKSPSFLLTGNLYKRAQDIARI